MDKKIKKQRERIEKLVSKKTEIEKKLSAVDSEIEEENKVLDNLEKDFVSKFMKAHSLDSETVVDILLKSEKVMTEQSPIENAMESEEVPFDVPQDTEDADSEEMIGLW